MGISKHPPEFLQCNQWPTVETEELEGQKLERFHTLKAAMEAVCKGERQSHVARRFGVSRSNLTHLLKRCVARHPDGRLWGYRALIKNTRQKDYTRNKKAEIASGADGYGLAGAFQQLMAKHPSIGKLIDKFIKGVGQQHVREGGLNVAGLHSDILDQLRKEGLGESDYPFNTISAGYSSLLRHFKRLMQGGRSGIARHRFGPAAEEGLQAGTGEQGILQAIHALDIACYDEQMLPFIGTLVVNIDGVEHDYPLSRGHLCVLVDTKSKCILGYDVTIAGRFRSLQLAAAYENFFLPWKPKELSVPGMKYKKGAGLPSGVLPQCRGRLVKIISIDNHLTHLAELIVGHLRRRTGAVLRYGQVRRWIARQTVEHVFAELQKHSFQRIPSTTGSGPDDPAVTHPTKKAVDLRIRIDQLLEMLDVIIANYNATPRRDLMAKTPLEAMARSLSDTSRLSILPKVPDSFLSDPQIAVEIIESTVAGNQASGRRPYVEIDKATYTNDILAQSWSMIGKKLTVHIKGDFRQVRAFHPDGKEFGSLMVNGHWKHSFHTREQRKLINQLMVERKLGRWLDDPVKAMQVHLVHEAKKSAAKNPYKISKAANKLASHAHKMHPETIRVDASALGEDEHIADQKPNPKSRGRRKFFGAKGDDHAAGQP